MSRRIDQSTQQLLTAVGNGAPSIGEKLAVVESIRAQSPEMGKLLDKFLIEDCQSTRKCVAELNTVLDELKKLLEKLTAPPWHEAVYLGPCPLLGGKKVYVIFGNSRRVVGLAADVDPSSLKVGDGVFLSEGLNVVLSKADTPACGETGIFDRQLPDGRLVVRCRDEEHIVMAAASLSQDSLKQGDEIRLDRSANLAYEKIERTQGSQFFIEETPKETFDDIGGLDHIIEEIKESVGIQQSHPQIFHKYKLERIGSMMFEGVPGGGKTLTAKGLANYLKSISPSGRLKFMYVKPGATLSCWYGLSEENIRELFRVAREAAAAHPELVVVVYLDEADSICGVKGLSHMRVDDRVVNALAAELDGLEARGNILVVSSCNHRDAIDPKLDRPGRLSDLVFTFTRPNREGARAIFEKYLRADIPYAQDGHGDDMEATRLSLIDAAVSWIFSSNGESDLATLSLSDGRQRRVTAAELISGAVIKNISRRAKELAARREAGTGESGVRLSDVLSATSESFDTAARALTRENCHRHLTDLPRNVPVEDVALLPRKVPNPQQFYSVVSL